jgi:hypothetical protein
LKLINIDKITTVGHGRPFTFKLDMANPKPSNWTSHIQLTTSNGNIFTNAYS